MRFLSERALAERCRRALIGSGIQLQMVGGRCYSTHDDQTGIIIERRVQLGRLARHLHVIRPWERLALTR